MYKYKEKLHDMICTAIKFLDMSIPVEISNNHAIDLELCRMNTYICNIYNTYHCIDNIGRIGKILVALKLCNNFVDFMLDIRDERQIQYETYDNKDLTDNQFRLLIIEEFGEMVKAWNDYTLLQKDTLPEFKKEAIQFCALVLQYLERIVD